MQPDAICSEGFALSNLLYAPEELGRGKLRKFYGNHAVLARVILIPSYALLGIVKTLLFPLIALVYSVALPIVALVGNKDNVKKTLQAWVFSLLALGGFLSFLVLSAFYLPMNVSVLLYTVGTVASLSVHVYRASSIPS